MEPMHHLVSRICRSHDSNWPRWILQSDACNPHVAHCPRAVTPFSHVSRGRDAIATMGAHVERPDTLRTPLILRLHGTVSAQTKKPTLKAIFFLYL